MSESQYCIGCGIPHDDGDCGRARKVDAIRQSINDALRLGIGHAIAVIEEYAVDVPVAKPFCDDLAATLRRHNATGMATQ